MKPGGVRGRSNDRAPNGSCWRALPALGLVLGLLLAGCASTPVAESWQHQQTVALQAQLLALSDSVDPQEAAQLAQVAVRRAAELAGEFRAVRPAWFHNCLVNSGRREQGLCFEWANRLYPSFRELGLKTLDFHLAVARLDTSREHNCVVATARQQALADGIVLDAWRRSGWLWSGPVRSDKYPWRPLPRDHVPAELEKYYAP